MSGYWVAEPGERGTHPAPPNTSCQSPSSQLGTRGGPAHWDARTHPPSCPAPFGPCSSVPSKFAFSAPNGRFPLALGSPGIGVYIRETEAQSHKAQNGLDSSLLAVVVTGPAALQMVLDPGPAQFPPLSWLLLPWP